MSESTPLSQLFSSYLNCEWVSSYCEWLIIILQPNSKWLTYYPLLTTFNTLKCFSFIFRSKIAPNSPNILNYIVLLVFYIHLSFLPLIWPASNFLSKAENSRSAMVLDPGALCLIPVKGCTASHSFLSTEKIWPSLFVSALSPPLYTACSQFSGINSNKSETLPSSTAEWLDGSFHTTWLIESCVLVFRKCKHKETWLKKNSLPAW